MELHYAPMLEQTATMKADFIPYGCSELNSAVNGILTPTTPSTKSITTNNPFFLPPPFDPFSYSQSPDGCFQVSPIEFSPSQKPSPSYGNTYGLTAENDGENYYNSCGYASYADTPDSVFEGGQDANQFDYDGNYFKFDPDTVERFMPQSNNFKPDIPYVNLNVEDNCNSKNQSPCSSPKDPWIMCNFNQQIAGSNSPKIENTQQFMQMHVLPPIDQAFSTHFTTTASNQTPAENASGAVYDFLDSYDTTTFFEEYAINEKSDSNEANDMQPTKGYIIPENYNIVEINEKPNREFKNIWDEEKLINAPAEFAEFQQQIVHNDDESPMTTEPSQLHITQCQEPDDGEQQLVCCWKGCNQEYTSLATLVLHIEKQHVCSSKGDEYTCLWTDCPRQYRSFNARYKLLIHMRVHSGEKPNKCPVSFTTLFSAE